MVIFYYSIQSGPGAAVVINYYFLWSSREVPLSRICNKLLLFFLWLDLLPVHELVRATDILLVHLKIFLGVPEPVSSNILLRLVSETVLESNILLLAT